MKNIYLKEEIEDGQRKATAYTTLRHLLGDIGMPHLYHAVRLVFSREKPFDFKNIIIRKVQLKHYSRNGKQ